MRRALFFAPLAVLALFAGFALWGLTSGRDPNAVPSALIGRAPPAMALPPLAGAGVPGFDPAALGDGPALVNVFASWCVPCRAEHPVLVRMAEEGVRVHGIAYKDAPEDAAAFLAELGNPYASVGVDESGRAGIEWGITGVPETFVIAGGRIVHRAAGPLVNETSIAPVRAALEAAR